MRLDIIKVKTHFFKKSEFEWIVTCVKYEGYLPNVGDLFKYKEEIYHVRKRVFDGLDAIRIYIV